MTTIMLLLVLSPAQLPTAATELLNHLSESRLEALLKGWEKATQDIRAAHYLIDWTREDSVLKEKEVFRIEGFIRRSKLARIDLKDNRGKTTIIYLLNDRTFDIYNFANEIKYSFEIRTASQKHTLIKDGWNRFSLEGSNRSVNCFISSFLSAKSISVLTSIFGKKTIIGRTFG